MVCIHLFFPAEKRYPTCSAALFEYEQASLDVTRQRQGTLFRCQSSLDFYNQSLERRRVALKIYRDLHWDKLMARICH